MKNEYELSKARRGPILPPTPGKTRITIRIDDDVLYCETPLRRVVRE